MDLTSSRSRWIRAVWILRRSTIQALVTFLPKGGHAVVSGFPDEEGNSVEVIRALASRWCGAVYWLVATQPTRLSWMLADAKGSARVRIVRRRSLLGLLLYATAKIAFFTHGLYSSPRPPSNATFVNLWHGDGPKRTANPTFSPKISASYMVAGTHLWGLKRAAFWGLNEDRLLITGHPRIDQFSRPATDLAMQNLGLDPRITLILWLPTYRETNTPGSLHWKDAPSLIARPDIQELIAEVAWRTRQHGIALIAKPHVLDIENFRGLGITTLTNEDLLRSRTGLYQLLGRTAAIITDYSSVWTDYLALDRPIGFFCPDLEEYTAGRGLSVEDLPSLLPGPLLFSAAEFLTFVLACGAAKDDYRHLRQNSIRTIGAETRLGATSRLLDQLQDRGVAQIVSS